MTPDVPKQQRRCNVYPWCTGHSDPHEIEHHGGTHTVPARDGREVRFSLMAVADGPLRVIVEAVLAEGEPPLDIVELDPADVVEAATVLRRLAVESQQVVDDFS